MSPEYTLPGYKERQRAAVLAVLCDHCPEGGPYCLDDGSGVLDKIIKAVEDPA